MSDGFFFHYGRYFILLAALIGFLNWSKLKSLQVHYFPVYLAIVYLGEALGYYFASVNDLENSSKLYFFLLPLQIAFFIGLIGFSGLEKKGLTIGLLMVFGLLYLLEYRNIKTRLDLLMSKAYSLGCVLLALLALLYFLKLVKSDRLLVYHKDIFFWVCIGVIAFYVASFPFYAMYNSLGRYHEKIFYQYRSIVYHLSCVMYLLFSIGFICSNKKQ